MPHELRDLGPASLAFPLSGAQLLGGRLYVVSRNIVPARLAVYDLSVRRVVTSLAIPEGAGAWGMTAATGPPTGELRYVYVGQFGARARPNLYRYDLRTGQLTAVALLDVAYIWSLAAMPDGTVFGVTAPDMVVRYDPVRDRADDVGIIDKSRDRVRAAAASTRTLFVGGARSGGALLLSVDVPTGRVVPALPPQAAHHQSVYSLAATDDLVAVGTTGPDLTRPALVVLDRRGGHRNAIVELPDEAVVDTVAITDLAVFLTARRSGSFYRYDLGLRELRRVSTPVPRSETRGLFRAGGTMVGASASGHVWTSDIRTEQLEVVDLLEAGLSGQPELAQSIAAGDGHVYVGGNFGVQVRNLVTLGSRRVFVPGEPKDMTVVDGVAYLAVYPSAEVWSCRPTSGRLEKLAQLPPVQNRPVTVEYDRAARRLLVATASDKRGGGALHVLGLADPAPRSFTDPLGPDQHPAGLACDGETAYLGGSGPHPRAAALDLATGRVRWLVSAVAPNGGTLAGLALLDDHLYGCTTEGVLVVLRASDGRVVARRTLPYTGGRIRAVGDRLYAASSDRLTLVDPATLATDVVVARLRSRIWGWPTLAADERGFLYVIRQSNLVQVRPPVPLR